LPSAFLINVTPHEVVPGARVTIEGYGIPGNSAVELVVAPFDQNLPCETDRGGTELLTTTSDPNGKFLLAHQPARPDPANVGVSYVARLAADPQVRSNVACISFTAPPPAAQIAIDVAPLVAASGVNITINGRGAPAFTRVQAIVAPFDRDTPCETERGGTEMLEALSDANGHFSFTHQAIRGSLEIVGLSYIARLAGAPETKSNVACVSFSAPAPDGAVLPAPLYYLARDRQIWRMERDGATRGRITDERAPIDDFDVGGADNALVYTVAEGDKRVVVLLDARGRRGLARGLTASPRFSPDGQHIAYALQDGSAPGVFIQGRDGEHPRRFQAGQPDGAQYAPIAWSPDGSQLLMSVSTAPGEGSTLAVKALASGEAIPIHDATGEATWSVDGSALTIAGGMLAQDAALGLWSADPNTGKTIKLLDASENAGGLPLATAARQIAPGTIYAFLTYTDAPSPEGRDKVTPQRVTLDGHFQPLRTDSYLLAGALWADDASGAVIVELDPNNVTPDGQLIWLPSDGSPPARLVDHGSLLRWGRSS
jgi:hypothetical protein